MVGLKHVLDATEVISEGNAVKEELLKLDHKAQEAEPVMGLNMKHNSTDSQALPLSGTHVQSNAIQHNSHIIASFFFKTQCFG